MLLEALEKVSSLLQSEARRYLESTDITDCFDREINIRTIGLWYDIDCVGELSPPVTRVKIQFWEAAHYHIMCAYTFMKSSPE